MDKHSNQNPVATLPSNAGTPKKVLAKAKFLPSNFKIKLPCFRLVLKRLIRGLIIGFIIGIVLNVIDAHYWTELSETIPAIFGFFNGFVTFVEFVYKTTLGGISSIFDGTFLEFNKSVNSEFVRILKEYWDWMSSISF